MSKRRSTSLNIESPSKSKLPKVTESENSETALQYLFSLFPLEHYSGRLPRIVMKHMVYSLVKDRTKADRDLDNLQSTGKLRLFKLGNEEESLAIILTDDFKDLVAKRCSESKAVQRYLLSVVNEVHDISVDKQTLCNLGLSDEDIKTLVNSNLITVRGVSSYWFSFPGAGEFMKCYTKGRKAITNTLKKAKYRQIHRDELESRIMKKAVPLGITYHTHDIIGADIVTRIDTTSGEVLRLDE